MTQARAPMDLAIHSSRRALQRSESIQPPTADIGPQAERLFEAEVLPDMSKSLITYINDHLGGAEIAIELLEAMCEHHNDAHFQQFARVLLPEVSKDEQLLRSIAQELGADRSPAKEAGGWLLEKLARLKLGHTGSADFEMFESLELLALGIQGKICLWKALQQAVHRDVRLRSHDFDQLIRRAEQQYAQAEEERLNLARTVLVP